MVAQDGQPVEIPTRQRLLDEGMRLFSEHGFRATTVGDIESAAGLQPRRGALYKHFPSKEALLEAAVQRHLDSVDQVSGTMDVTPSSDVGEVATALGWWLLAEMDAERTVTRLLEREGERFPELVDRFRERVSDAGYRAASELLAGLIGPTSGDIDLDALAVIVISPLVNLRRSTWLLSQPPLGLDDERLVAMLADACVRLVASFAEDR